MDIEAIKRRLEAAHRGPWRVAKSGEPVLQENLSKPGATYFSSAEDNCIVGPDGEEVLGCSEWIRVELADLEFMANARRDVADLLAEIDRLKTGSPAQTGDAGMRGDQP